MTKHKRSILKSILICIVVVISIISVLLLINSNYYEINKNSKLGILEPLSLDDLITLDVEIMDSDGEYYICLLIFISNDDTNKIKKIEDVSNIENSNYSSNNISIYTLDSEGKEKIGVDYKYKIGDTEEKVFRVTTTKGDVIDKKFSNLEMPTVEFGEVTWLNEKASIEISKKGTNTKATRYWIEYQIKQFNSQEETYPEQDEGAWIQLSLQETSKLLENLELNNLIYARLNNGKITSSLKSSFKWNSWTNYSTYTNGKYVSTLLNTNNWKSFVKYNYAD